MVDDPERVARQAYAGFAAGDTAAVLSLVDEDLEWTFLDPTVPDPQPAVCHGRDQFAHWMGRDSGWRLRAELEEVIANGERVLVVAARYRRHPGAKDGRLQLPRAHGARREDRRPPRLPGPRRGPRFVTAAVSGPD
jgi:ketosteroid isomerase-like protein